MDLEIAPEPKPDERAVIVAALADLDRHAEPSAWWLAGTQENVEENAER